MHHHLIPLRFLPTTSANSAQDVDMLKEKQVKQVNTVKGMSYAESVIALLKEKLGEENVKIVTKMI